MTIEEILAAMTAIIDNAGDRSLTDEEVANYEKLEADLAAKRKDAELRARNQAYNTPVPPGAPLHPQPDDGRKAEHAAAFNRYLRTGDKALLTEFRNAQSVGTDSEGGFTAPEEFRTKLVERMKRFGGLAAEAEEITTETGNKITWPTLDDTSNEGEIASEGSAGSSGSDLVFGEKELEAHKYVAPGGDGSGSEPLRVSVELLQDSAFDIEALVIRVLGRRIARKQAEHWATGDGSSKPTGITDPSADRSFDTHDDPDFEDLVDTLHLLDPDYQENAKWLMNFATVGHFRKKEDDNGRPLWLPQQEAGMTTMPGGILLGRPVVVDQAMPNHDDTSAKAIVYGDLEESYVIRRVRDVQLVVDPFTRAAQGQVAYTVWARADGVPQNDDSFVILGNTAS